MRFIQLFIGAVDYMFYRIAKAYYKWDSQEAITAIFTISIFYCFLICFPAVLITRYYFGRSFLTENANIAKPILIIVALFFLLLNFFRYRGKFDILSDKYKNETVRKRTLKGILVLLALLVPIIVFILGSVYL